MSSDQTFMEQAQAYGKKALTWYQRRARENATREAVAREAAAGQSVVEYTGSDAMQRGIAEMARQGWRVQSQSSYQPRAGCLRVLMLGGIGALVFKPKPRFLVTFTR